MNASDLEGLLRLSRHRTTELLDVVTAAAQATDLLRWRPGPGRAHLGWQFMHIAATQDKHLNVRMLGAPPREPDFVRRFTSGSVPDDNIPPIAVIRQYLDACQTALLNHLRGLSDAELAARPRGDAPYVYREWFQVLALHEAYHHGQAHLTYNLYRTTQDPTLPTVGH